MGGRRMRPNRLLVWQCLIYLVPTFAAALSMCNNQAPAESGKNINVKVSRVAPHYAATVSLMNFASVL
ncbi:hypothetical protein MTO96_043580 [Rhipicephalus appendiculatus]